MLRGASPTPVASGNRADSEKTEQVGEVLRIRVGGAGRETRRIPAEVAHYTATRQLSVTDVARREPPRYATARSSRHGKPRRSLSATRQVR